MALYIPHSIFHLARLLYVRPENFGPYYVVQIVYVTPIYRTIFICSRNSLLFSKVRHHHNVLFIIDFKVNFKQLWLTEADSSKAFEVLTVLKAQRRFDFLLKHCRKSLLFKVMLSYGDRSLHMIIYNSGLGAKYHFYMNNFNFNSFFYTLGNAIFLF
jgi:hypothetical protein